MASHADRGAFEVCAHCGERLVGSGWFPATTQVEDGTVLVRSFCDERCQAAWDERENKR